MHMTFLLSAVLAALLAIGQASGSSKPNFSGQWKLDASRSASEDVGQQLDVKQTETEIVITTARDATPIVRTYPIDPLAQPSGTANVSAAPRAYWNGARLVTEGSGTVQGQTVSTRETMSLNPAATEMTIERLVVVQHGYSFRGAQNYGMGKDVYVRQR
jgi:hypothetical protein